MKEFDLTNIDDALEGYETTRRNLEASGLGNLLEIAGCVVAVTLGQREPDQAGRAATVQRVFEGPLANLIPRSFR